MLPHHSWEVCLQVNAHLYLGLKVGMYPGQRGGNVKVGKYPDLRGGNVKVGKYPGHQNSHVKVGMYPDLQAVYQKCTQMVTRPAAHPRDLSGGTVTAIVIYLQ